MLYTFPYPSVAYELYNKTSRVLLIKYLLALAFDSDLTLVSHARMEAVFFIMMIVLFL